MHRIFAVTLLAMFASTATAEDALDKDLADFSSDRPWERERADTRLRWKGEEARARILAARDAAKEVELRDRLSALLRWIDAAPRRAAWEKAAADRWFVVESEGKPTGWEHSKQSRHDFFEGDAWWYCSSEAVTDLGRPGEAHALAEWRSRAGPVPGPVDMRVRLRDDQGLDMLAFLDDGSDRVRLSVFASDREHDWTEVVAKGNYTFGKSDVVAIWETDLTTVVELASLCREGSLAVRSIPVFFAPRDAKGTTWPVKVRTIQFDKEESVDAAGRSWPARRYSDGSDRWWVSDEVGLVQAETPGGTTKLSTRDAVASLGPAPRWGSGPSPADRVKALVDAPEAKRRDAELDLLATGPEALPAVRAALAKSEGDLRARLERDAAWLDPESKALELAAMATEREFRGTRKGEGERRLRLVREDETEVNVHAIHFAWDETPLVAGAKRGLTLQSRQGFEPDGMTPLGVRVNLAKPNPDPKAASWDTESRAEGRASIENGLLVMEFQLGFIGPKTRRVKSMDSPTAVLACDATLFHLLERATLVGVRSLRLSFWSAYEKEMPCALDAAETGEEEVTAGGVRMRAHRWDVTKSGAAWGAVWVHEGWGAVRAELPELTIEREGVRPPLPNAAAAAALVNGDAAGRDAAEQDLLAMDEAAIPAIREALTSAPDADAKSRLERAAAWLDPASRAAVLEQIRRDRWFASVPVRGQVDWEHAKGERVLRAGKPVWSLASEAQVGDVLKPEVQSLSLTCEASPWLTPLEGEVRVSQHGDASFRIGRVGSFLRSEFTERHGYTRRIRDFRDPSGRPVLSSLVVAEVVERASLLRVPRLDVLFDRLSIEDARVPVRIRFAAEEERVVRGASRRTRRYDVEIPSGRPDSYWVDDELGLVGARVSGIEISASDAAGVEAAKAEAKKQAGER